MGTKNIVSNSGLVSISRTPLETGAHGSSPAEKRLTHSPLFRRGFHPPLHLSSPCHPPQSFLSKAHHHHHQCAPGAVLGCVGWRGDEGSKARRCNRALSSSLCRAVTLGEGRGGRSDTAQHQHSALHDIFLFSVFRFTSFIYLFLQRQKWVKGIKRIPPKQLRLPVPVTCKQISAHDVGFRHRSRDSTPRPLH